MKTLFLYAFLSFLCVSVFCQDKSMENLSGDPFGQTAFINSEELKHGEIIFPNAFKWNGTGSTGGYWNSSQVNDNIFRPFCSNVDTYKLRILSRSGALIFESTDISKGWDGYSKNGSLATQGVYIWIVSGKFSDGTYFRKMGDVTFLH